MKTKDSISPQDIVKVSDHIHKKWDSYGPTEIQRAKTLLNYLTIKGNKLLYNIFQGRSLWEYLYNKSLMPVLSKPSQSYPDELEWKGSSKMLNQRFTPQLIKNRFTRIFRSVFDRVSSIDS